MLVTVYADDTDINQISKIFPKHAKLNLGLQMAQSRIDK